MKTSTRIFILLLKITNPNPNLNINNLSGEGRFDLLSRVLTNVFFLGGGDFKFRTENELWMYFQSYGKKLVFKGNEIRGMNPDERSQAGILKKVFSGEKIKGIEYSSAKWTEISRIFPNCIILDETGYKFDELDISSNIFLMGDHLGLTEEEKLYLSKHKSLSLGKRIYLSSQCVSIINYYLDQTHQDNLNT